MTDRLSDERLREFLCEPLYETIVPSWRECGAMARELLELRDKLDAYRRLENGQLAQLAFYQREDRRDHAARATLESEREANSRLTEENESLRAKLAAGAVMPEAPSADVLDAATTAVSWVEDPEVCKVSVAYHAFRAALLKEQA